MVMPVARVLLLQSVTTILLQFQPSPNESDSTTVAAVPDGHAEHEVTVPMPAENSTKPWASTSSQMGLVVMAPPPTVMVYW
jgi:hypothetical protein